jgi:hypothetical protein
MIHEINRQSDAHGTYRRSDKFPTPATVSECAKLTNKTIMSIQTKYDMEQGCVGDKCLGCIVCEQKPQGEFIIKCTQCGCVTDTTEFPEYEKGQILHWKNCPMLLDDEPDNQD